MRLRRQRSVVVDASVLINAFTSPGEVGEHARRALRGTRWSAPEQVRVEAFNGIRGRVLGDKIDIDLARHAIDSVKSADIKTVRTTALLDRMWELRANFSGYDAAYVAAAEHLGVPLLTSDQRLAAAPGPRCSITVV